MGACQVDARGPDAFEDFPEIVVPVVVVDADPGERGDGRPGTAGARLSQAFGARVMMRRTRRLRRQIHSRDRDRN
jgi:hypothetical protein